VSLAAIAWTNLHSGRVGPLAIAAAGATVVALGHFAFASEALELGGLLLFPASSLWGLRLARAAQRKGQCGPRCDDAHGH
jgi:hypothetical protein